MTGREREERSTGGSEVDWRDGPFHAIWDQVISQWGDFFSTATTSTSPTENPADASTAARATSSQAEPSPTAGTMQTTTAIPVSTVTVAETSFRTTFVTVPLTADLSPSYAPVSHTGEETKMSACTSRSPTARPSPQTPESKSRIQGIPLPTFVTSLRPSASLSTMPPANTPESASAPSEAPPAGTTATSTTQKHAIIGGLSGSIAGVLFIALFVCLWWRGRKPRFVEDDDDFDSKLEKGLRPMVARKWSELKSRSPTAPPSAAVAAVAATRVSNRTSRSFSPSTSTDPQDDGPVLRVSLDNWARPYARDAGYRESQGPTTLRVMNPDLSRPSSPLRPSLETASSFLKRQRNVLAAALSGGRVASPSPLGRQSGVGSAEAAGSNESLAPKAVAPSVRSGSSGLVVVQQPPEDPFLTPPDERAEAFSPVFGSSHPTTPAHENNSYITRPTEPPPVATTTTMKTAARPSISPLQHQNTPTHSAARTLSSTLNLFSSLRRNRSNASSSTHHTAAPSSSLGLSRSGSRRSTQTFSSAGDPFMLDRGTPRVGRGEGPVVYEGT